MQPLVVTVALPDDLQQRMDELRTRYFPPGRTQVGAHITLFHAVPGRLESAVRHALAEAMRAGSMTLRFTHVMSLGRGVALAVESEELARRHRILQRDWLADLTPQDRQPLRAHVTVQNKVDPSVAKATATELAHRFVPFTAVADGFDLWRYDGGPWTHLIRVRHDDR